jgi:hypothetical protein
MIEKLIDFSLNTTDKTMVTSPKNRAKSAFDRQRNTTGTYRTIRNNNDETNLVSNRMYSNPISP